MTDRDIYLTRRDATRKVAAMHTTARLISTGEAAERLGVSVGTLRNWRSERRGPRWVKNPDTGNFLGYPDEALDEWLSRSEPEVTS